jgi:GntR family transcriptional regulator
MEEQRPLAFHPSVPLHHQITRLLRTEISNGTVLPGERLSTEPELARRFGVSRNTIREALKPLDVEGLLIRTRGRGTYLSDNAGKGRRLFTVNNLLLGFETQMRLLSARRTRPPTHIASFFGLQAREELMQIVRLRVSDGLPLSAAFDFLPLAMGTGLSREDLRRKSILELLRDELRTAIGGVTQVLEARLADQQISHLLGIDLTQPVFFQRLLVRDSEGRPIHTAETHYRADRFRYELEFTELPQPGVKRWRVLPAE